MSDKESHGADKIKVDDLLTYLKQNDKALRASILEGTYRLSPVRKVEMPKPDGGKRLLGIPTVIDRMVQQANAQILSPIFENIFFRQQLWIQT